MRAKRFIAMVLAAMLSMLLFGCSSSQEEVSKEVDKTELTALWNEYYDQDIEELYQSYEGYYYADAMTEYGNLLVDDKSNTQEEVDAAVAEITPLRDAYFAAKEAGTLTPIFTSSTSNETTGETETESTSATTGETNALRMAKSYLDTMPFSYTGLIDQLEYEGFTTEEATYGVDNCGADWNKQALACAEDYLDYSAFSYTGLIDQLEYEGFTTEQATYGADNCGADWNEQAALCAENYLEYSAFSRSGLIDQLEYEGFTNEQAVYGADSVGL